MITRQCYVDGIVSHDEYYGQFGRHLIELVSSTIGRDAILNSTCEHFNDIPLKRWDSLEFGVRGIVGQLISKTNNGGVSLSDCVCSAKAAAKIIREHHKEKD